MFFEVEKIHIFFEVKNVMLTLKRKEGQIIRDGGGNKIVLSTSL